MNVDQTFIPELFRSVSGALDFPAQRNLRPTLLGWPYRLVFQTQLITVVPKDKGSAEKSGR
jgi:hypothetical protein